MTELEKLVAQLDGYLPPAIGHQQPDGPHGPGTLKGFHAKIAEVFRLGMDAGWQKAIAVLDEAPNPATVLAKNRETHPGDETRP